MASIHQTLRWVRSAALPGSNCKDEEAVAQDAAVQLMLSKTDKEVISTLLAHINGTLGADATVLRSREGKLLGQHGAPSAEPSDHGFDINFPFGTATVFAGSHGHYFHEKQLRIVQSFGELANIAIERCRHIERVLANEARLTRAEEVGHFGSWEWDIVTNDLHWSDEQFRIHGLSPNDPTPDIATIKAFCHPDDLRQVQELFSKVLADPVRHQPSFDWEIRIVRADGQVRSLACHATIVTDQDGMPIRILGVAHDITERKGAEHERQTFIANAAHELRTPLTSLAGFAKLLNVSWDRMSEDAISSSLQAMARQGDRATSLINNLLDMAQLESGQITVAVEPVNVHSVVSRALVKHPVPSGVTMTLVGERDILVRADPIRLEQVISNLISNAYKFGGKLIEISVQKTETGARLVVADDGPGINDQVAATIFDPFVRGTSRQHIAGSGLGLAIARQLSEAMGGRLRYESNPPMGARFVVELGAALGTDRSRTSLKIDNL